MIRIKRTLSQYYHFLKPIIKDIALLRKGQNNSAAILMTSHRLEKGLMVKEPRNNWGWEKAEYLLDLLKKHHDENSNRVGTSVILTYLESKLKSGDENEKIKAKNILSDLSITTPERGGYISFKKPSLDVKSFRDLLETRHSIREFTAEPIDKDKLMEAIELANRCPSACNRQPFHVYVLNACFRNKITPASYQPYNADKYLIITGEKTAFEVGELYDWIFNAGIFAGYLSLTLHAEGIGCCFHRRVLIPYDEYSISLHQKCGIPNTEQVIIELAVGNYGECRVPVSQRKSAVDLTTFVE